MSEEVPRLLCFPGDKWGPHCDPLVPVHMGVFLPQGLCGGCPCLDHLARRHLPGSLSSTQTLLSCSLSRGQSLFMCPPAVCWVRG